MDDPYFRLRPPPPTPSDEMCSCPTAPPIMLMWALGYNPILCLDCNLEVDPEQLPLPLGMVDTVAHWNAIAGAIHRLELDSGPYEEWAQRQLGDLSSPVNVDGLRLRDQLGEALRYCYYVLYQPLTDDGIYSVPDACPVCGGDFVEYPNGRLTRLLCERCCLAIVNP
jgi:hypothetical protein